MLEQGAAIRVRDVETVVRYAGAMQVEMQRRVSIEQTRAQLLERAGVRLGVTAASVTLERSRSCSTRRRPRWPASAARSCVACSRRSSASTPSTAR